ncbi:MAG TPA: thioredoxin domain-containing protein [Candidatus Kapabacteria bacterium]|nr:thioredoxin domain-containing protein [Candidatus Kapabacteria bacterium]
MPQDKKPNRLVHEKSPYLLQHAYNPVDWYPWGEEAFAKAKKENKPIFLSIGYSTCYWCHVMEREVFENTKIAELMNKYAVCIKVDREERPDVDRVYMAAVQAMTGSGGWPMSVFLTPDLKPFYAGTYIPPTSQYGRPGFVDVISQIHGVWEKDPDKILRTGADVAEYLAKLMQPEISAGAVSKEILDSGFASFARNYDTTYAGFGGGAKFPRPVSFNFLFRYYKRTGNQQALAMSLETLKRMANGGIHDHIGGGFHRYATDNQWRLPHFEKMLYDQAQLSISYLEAYQITRDEWYAGIARDVLGYVQQKMTSPEGGFYSAEDAESAVDITLPDEKEEGEFYVWRKDEIEDVLGAGDAAIFNYYYGVEEGGNALHDPQNVFLEKNILYVAHSLVETSVKFERAPEDIQKLLPAAREKLYTVRERRPKPHLDDKILVSWNGLMISAFARAYQVLGDKQYLHATERAAGFILNKLYDPAVKRFLRRYRDGEARFDANLEDYSFFIQGLLDLYEASFNVEWLQAAIALLEQQNNFFYDKEHGGFYDTPAGDSSLLIRTKETYDGAEPTGNSIALLNLLRLAQMTDKNEWRDMVNKSFEYFGAAMTNNPQPMAQFLVALDMHLAAPQEIVVAGTADDPRMQTMLREIHSHFLPHKVLILADGSETQRVLESYLPFMKDMGMIGGVPAVYVCENYACQLPTTDINQLRQLLDKNPGV